MSDLLYILGDGSRCGDKEIRYSLRSACKYLDFDRFYLVGEKPNRIAPDTYIEAEDPYDLKVQNAYHKYRIGLEADISEDVVFMNDDFILMEPHSPRHYWKGTIEQEVLERSGTQSRYWHGMVKTLGVFPEGLNFEVHYPFPVKKSEWLEVMDTFETLIQPGGALLRNLYGNTTGAFPRQEITEDCKTYEVPYNEEDYSALEGKSVVSLSDEAMHVKTLQWLDALLPDKCRYET